MNPFPPGMPVYRRACLNSGAAVMRWRQASVTSAHCLSRQNDFLMSLRNQRATPASSPEATRTARPAPCPTMSGDRSAHEPLSPAVRGLTWSPGAVGVHVASCGRPSLGVASSTFGSTFGGERSRSARLSYQFPVLASLETPVSAGSLSVSSCSTLLPAPSITTPPHCCQACSTPCASSTPQSRTAPNGSGHRVHLAAAAAGPALVVSADRQQISIASSSAVSLQSVRLSSWGSIPSQSSSSPSGDR